MKSTEYECNVILNFNKIAAGADSNPCPSFESKYFLSKHGLYLKS